MNNCGTCKHWQTTVRDDTVDESVQRYCQRISSNGESYTKMPDGELAQLQTSDYHDPDLATHRDFGCVLHESIDPETR